MRKIVFCCLTVLLFCCKDKYDAPIKAPITGYLVIEGYISAKGPAEIHLSRSIPLSDTAKLINETLAKVQLLGRDNSTYNLTETPGAVYTNTLLTLNNSQQYRLYIKTKDGKEYASDYVNVRNAAPIDSVGWLRQDGGVQIYVNGSDPNNNTWYYRWSTEETWEFHMIYEQSLKYTTNPGGTVNGVDWINANMHPIDTVRVCWAGENSTSLILGSSAKLSKDSIHKSLIYIPPSSWKLGVLYSVLVKQYALSKEEYEYLDKMKKNSEETGNIFGRQPSELKGNVHCISNPNDPVIGYIGIANRQEKRIFIDRSQVPDWNYYLQCETYDVPVDSAKYYSSYRPVIATDWGPFGITRYLAVQPTCVDCTLQGVNKKPSFWP
ncbi:hypothetical protein A4D02_03200 [Niastella koreensis]|uniref:DUF4249 domain-containing protein n=2 Tax=Niastella koreensis TaxID=354356 RepID=G8TLE3_NIAKG|nr:DUF4249 domain-containing protein [Niastella koreensis]AEW03016.1 hypothetical protein Niako_6792 [Niastella koreensis GR20-10]OQP55330.1 hypothetical protein A4D02_03200 [Niastella koreensis]